MVIFLYLLPLILTSNLCTAKFNAAAYLNSNSSDSGKYSGELEQDNPANGTSYDFIIVGAGASGGALAAKLAQLKKYKVLLLEAGPFPTWTTIVPYLRADVRTRSQTDWEFVTVPQKGLNNRTLVLSQGKLVGGCASHNGMIYQRGNRRDYERWAQITGDSSWNYANLLKYFKRMETYQGRFPSDVEHGSSGPLTISDVPYAPLSKEFMAAGRELGFPPRDQSIMNQQSSFTITQMNIRQGKRSSVYEGYIYPAYAKNLLTLLPNAYVVKVNVNETTLKATSVTFIRHEETLTVTARKEIILSAGAIKTPQLLMLSGIGPPAHLQEFRIKPIIDSPGVGQNFHDHFSTTLGPFQLSPGSGYIESRDLTKKQLLNYLLLSRGPLSFAYITGMGLWNTNGDHSWPNVLYAQILLPTTTRGQEVDSVSAFSSLGTPYSRGSITLRSSDPWDQPNINPNYNDDPHDKLDALKGAKFITNLYENTKPFKRLGGTLLNTVSPKCPGFSQRGNNDDYYKCHIQNTGGAGFHFASSARMGRVDDPMAVLDSQMRVKGVSGLRVVDASAMPSVVNANSQIICFMLGEKAADLIDRQWR